MANRPIFGGYAAAPIDRGVAQCGGPSCLGRQGLTGESVMALYLTCSGG